MPQIMMHYEQSGDMKWYQSVDWKYKGQEERAVELKQGIF